MKWKDAVDGLAHLFYPSLCPGCGSNQIQAGELLCFLCHEELPFTDFSAMNGNPIEHLFRGRIGLVAATSLLYFSKQSVIRNLMHQFKYEGNKKIGLYFGRRMGEAIMNSKRFLAADLLVPLPLHAHKEKKRGYNQAMILCEGMSEVMRTKIADDLVIRKKETQTQTFRNRIERWENISSSFELTRPGDVNGKHLLLVDDVVTTGATLEACGTELLKSKGASLSIATLAFTTL
jgi:ComF family protein